MHYHSSNLFLAGPFHYSLHFRLFFGSIIWLIYGDCGHFFASGTFVRVTIIGAKIVQAVVDLKLWLRESVTS